MRRRTVLMLALFLLAGAAINVAVAWECVVTRGDVGYAHELYHNPSSTTPLVIAMTENLGYRIVQGVDRSGSLLDSDPQWVKHYPAAVWWNEDAIRPNTNNYAIACGWPSLALTSWRTVLSEDEMAFPGVIHHGVLWKSIISRHPRGTAEVVPAVLALQPLWPGFATNTLFYAVALWLLIRGPLELRRRRRIRRGRCPACVYPVGSSPVCTECGRPVTAGNRG